MEHRLRRGTPKGKTKTGPESPASAIEPVILQFAKWKQEANQAMKSSEGLEFANSIIEGSEVKDKIRAHQISSKKNPNGQLAAGWWKGFLHRYRAELKSAKGHRLASSRQDWTTYENIQEMYRLVYEQMVAAGVAVHLPEEDYYFVNQNGEVCEEADAAGLKCAIKITHPEYILFGDEVGQDIAQDTDGHVGGQTYLSVGGQQVNLTSSKVGGRTTVIGLTAATGEAVYAVIIFAASELGVLDRLGFDHRSRIPYDKTKSLTENSGEGKALPGAPKCYFRGKWIPAVVTLSKSGSVSSDILVDVLKHLDNLGIYDRTEHGPIPFLLLDAHNSRLQQPFLG